MAKRPPKPHPFTEEQVRARAHKLWQQRGDDSKAEDNWNAAIRQLTRDKQLKRVLAPVRRLWWWSGDRLWWLHFVGTPAQQVWRWTGIKEKKGWDVVQLLAGVSIPIVLFVGGQYFSNQNNERQRSLADDKAKQDTLVKYLDQMAESLGKGLLKAKPSDDQFIVAQSRTVLALQSLDRKRQHLVIQFLQASGLNQVSDQTKPDKDGKVKLRDGDRVLLYQAQMSKADLVNNDLSGAVMIGANLQDAKLGCMPPESKDPDQCSDLSGANLSGADIRGADLSGANIRLADLSRAILRVADLSRARLNFAKLRDADLSLADLSRANLYKADLSRAILHYIDLRNVRGLTQQQLEGQNPPLLCNVALPKKITINKDRDCDRLPQELFKRYPELINTLDDAKQHVDTNRKKQWK